MISFGLRFLRALGALTQRFAALIVVMAALLTVVAGGYVAEHLKINTDTSDMLSPDLPFRRLSRAFDAAFPQFADTIVVVIDGMVPEHVDQAALRLAARLRQHPEVFGMVQDLAGGHEFERAGGDAVIGPGAGGRRGGPRGGGTALGSNGRGGGGRRARPFRPFKLGTGDARP